MNIIQKLVSTHLRKHKTTQTMQHGMDRCISGARLLGPRNCINLRLCRLIQFQPLGQVQSPLHYRWILVQQFSQLLTLSLKHPTSLNTTLSQVGKTKSKLTSFAPNSVKKWSSRLRLASRT